MLAGTKGADCEIEILRNLPKHRNVVTFHRAFQMSNKIYIFLELCDQGNLTDFIAKRNFIDPETRRKITSAADAQYIIRSIVKGLSFLSKNRIMHRDIKLDNVFVKLKDSAPTHSIRSGKDLPIENFEFKLGDFGLAKKLRNEDDINVSFCGTPLHMGPEVLGQLPYD